MRDERRKSPSCFILPEGGAVNAVVLMLLAVLGWPSLAVAQPRPLPAPPAIAPSSAPEPLPLQLQTVGTGQLADLILPAPAAKEGPPLSATPALQPAPRPVQPPPLVVQPEPRNE